MCGFVAIHSQDAICFDADLLRRMTDLLAHRGPDDDGYLIEPGIAIGFRRLSILDLSPSGHQPMASADGRHVIVFNGEIFNYLELRAELQALGHVFRSTSDTEVLLAAWRQWGRDCLSRLNGMWAFLVWDRETRTLSGARDRFGVKPLYWYADGSSIALTSEIKSLRDSGYARLEVDTQTVAQMLLAGSLDESEATFYRNVRSVAPGTCFEISGDGQIRWHRYWSIAAAVAAHHGAPADPVEEFAALFEDAVRLRMRSDVPVGVLLSGGLDSTSIACAMARVLGPARHPDDLLAFCFIAPEFDEMEFIEATLRQTRATFIDSVATPLGLWDRLGEHLWHQDEPVHSMTSLIGDQLVERARGHGVKVLLNGQGADETLGGYPNYLADYWSELARRRRWKQLLHEVRARRRLDRESYRQRLIQAARDVVGRMSRQIPGYATLAAERRIRRMRRDDWTAPELQSCWVPSAAAFPDTAAASMCRSVERASLPVYLRVEDRNSMAHGVELRVPFLDYRLVTLAFRVDTSWKLRDGLTKYLLRESMRGRIPEPVRTRVPKFGFPTPVDRWFRAELYAPMKDLLQSRSVREAGFWNVEVIDRALEAHRRGEISVGARLFDVAQMSMWVQLSQRSCAHEAEGPRALRGPQQQRITA